MKNLQTSFRAECFSDLHVKLSHSFQLFTHKNNLIQTMNNNDIIHAV